MKRPQILFKVSFSGWSVFTKVIVDNKRVGGIYPIGLGSMYGTPDYWLLRLHEVEVGRFDTKEQAKEKVRRMLG